VYNYNIETATHLIPLGGEKIPRQKEIKMNIELVKEVFGGSIHQIEYQATSWESLSLKEKKEVEATGKVVVSDTTEHVFHECNAAGHEVTFQGQKIYYANWERFKEVEGKKTRAKIKKFWKRYKSSAEKELENIEPEIINAIISGGTPNGYSFRCAKKIEKKIKKYL
jgi:hypothetical protein